MEHSVVDVGDVRLAYRTWGDAYGAPVVLLHGLGSSAAGWDEAGQALGEEWRVYAIDLRGHGESDWPDEYSLELMRDDVLGFLDELELDRVGVVGHGMGGVVAYLLAQEHADRVERLVLEETPPPFPGDRDARAVPVVLPDEPVTYDPSVAAAISGEIADPDPAWLDGLGEIVAPTMLITGGPDSSLPQDRMPDMAALIPDCRLITMAAGHHIHEERPRPFAQEVTEFLTS
ncbi:alpha/beta fold hydrolase [Streptomyces hypolithicus]